MAKTVERVSDRATKKRSSTSAVPNIAVAKRQPNELSGPNSHMPAPIRYLPSGGCTTKLGSVVKMSVSPAANLTSAPSGQVAA